MLAKLLRIFTVLCNLRILHYSVYLVYFPLLCVSCVFSTTLCISCILHCCLPCQAEYKWGHGWVHTRTSAGSDMHTRSGWTSWPGLDFPCSHLTLLTYSKLPFLATNIGHVDHLELLLVYTCYVEICIWWFVFTSFVHKSTWRGSDVHTRLEMKLLRKITHTSIKMI